MNMLEIGEEITLVLQGMFWILQLEFYFLYAYYWLL